MKTLTKHANKMLLKRGITNDICEFVIKYGYKTLTHANSVLCYMPKEVESNLLNNFPIDILNILPNLRVVTNIDNDIIITAYIKSPLNLDKAYNWS